jgi:hypothetical protein
MAHADLSFTVDIGEIVREQVAQTRARVDEAYKELLREVFEAGYESGWDDGIGYQHYLDDRFEEWLPLFIESNRQD